MPEPLTAFALREPSPADTPGTTASIPGLDAAQLQRTGLRAGMDALDVGCDTGSMAYLMRTIVGPGRVVGVDRSPTRLAQARLLAAEHGLEVEFVAGEPTQLPLPAAAFDYTWSRFSLAYLPQPEQALAELVRVTQPGGTVVVGDLDGQIAQFYPLAPPLRDDLDEALRLLGATGFDPWTGRKLYGWCQRAGLRDLVVHVLPYQVYAGGVPAGDMRDWQEKLTASSQQLVEQTGERTRWEHFRDGMLAAIQEPDIFYYCTLVLVRGRVPCTNGG